MSSDSVSSPLHILPVIALCFWWKMIVSCIPQRSATDETAARKRRYLRTEIFRIRPHRSQFQYGSKMWKAMARGFAQVYAAYVVRLE